MSNRFHLALEAGSLELTLPFYTDILGCNLDMCEKGRWQDLDFWGNELTLHESQPRKEPNWNLHAVDTGTVYVPHFGVHLDYEIYNSIKDKIKNDFSFIQDPYTRFIGTSYEQETFFVQDPNYNLLELKTFRGSNGR